MKNPSQALPPLIKIYDIHTCIQIHIRSSLAIKCMKSYPAYAVAAVYIIYFTCECVCFVYICAGEACDFILWLVGLENVKLHSLRRHHSQSCCSFSCFTTWQEGCNSCIFIKYIFCLMAFQQAFHTINIESAPHLPTAAEN